MTDLQFEEGDRVRIDIPDETDPDYNRHQGRHGEIIAILVFMNAPSRYRLADLAHDRISSASYELA